MNYLPIFSNFTKIYDIPATIKYIIVTNYITNIIIIINTFQCSDSSFLDVCI